MESKSRASCTDLDRVEPRGCIGEDARRLLPGQFVVNDLPEGGKRLGPGQWAAVDKKRRRAVDPQGQAGRQVLLRFAGTSAARQAGFEQPRIQPEVAGELQWKRMVGNQP